MNFGEGTFQAFGRISARRRARRFFRPPHDDLLLDDDLVGTHHVVVLMFEDVAVPHVLVGDVEVRPHHTPGHCPGGVCLQIGRSGQKATDLFVGDTLFAGSIGRTDLPGGDYTVLMRSITKVLFALGDEAVVHPGHGADTTIARERTTNPFVLEYLAGT